MNDRTIVPLNSESYPMNPPTSNLAEDIDIALIDLDLACYAWW